ncbi:CaiB/BaiF CoA transferase family protein [Curvivirga aplysinae]|uniref:CaiB/BaiF CoA transferase family protein n=1 Tax=Curvivirga aplysinae TaxID=2529852 RepID=UPI0012BBFB4F|nr:CaiB/BaiF CoA-transferase family protein [Curvivirga aplysinae]MTI10618.1 CoA transferase [Curvivirga aplysinae]
MGPLAGIKIVEMAGVGPGPFCAMLLSDMGADVIRLERPGGNNLLGLKYDILNRGRRSVEVDLKTFEGVERVLKLVEKADGLIEGFRPGVMERLGLGPDICLERNKKLIFGRMTGWGQDGPLAGAAGHDINYAALTGALHAIGTKDSGPIPPLNLVADFGGGAMYLAFGIVCGLLEAKSTGKGQVIDAAMVDGASHMMAMAYAMFGEGKWVDQRQSNMLDGAAHFYGCYECEDGKWVSIGSIEPQFYALLLEKADISDPEFDHQMDLKYWPHLKDKLTAIFKSKSREEWCEIMEGTDICFAPVLSLSEAPNHPHLKARNTFVDFDGVIQPAPTPRFSRTKVAIKSSPPSPGQHTEEVLAEWGIDL